MTRLEMKSSNMTLIEKLQKHQNYHVVKLINMSIVTGEEILPPNQSRLIEQAKFT